MTKNEKTKETKKAKKNNSTPKEKMNLYAIDTIVTFRHKYVIEAKSLEHAYDELIMKESGNDKDYFEEITQKCVGETILDGREISRKEFSNMLESFQDNDEESCSWWLGEDLIRKVNYEK